MTTETAVHAFERSGCGRAPFRLLGVEERRGPMTFIDKVTGQQYTSGSPGQPMGTCAHCGTGIAVCCTIQDADGKRFIVGNVCVNKTSDKGLVDQTRKAINARLAEARHTKAMARFAWIKENLERAKPALERLPDPNGYKGRTAYDWATWMVKNAGDAGRKRVEKLMKEAMEEAI